MNAAYYASLLHILRDAIREKRRGMLSRGVGLLHDHAAVHTAAVAKDAVKECGVKEIEHPPYSPDLAPSDYYLFSKLKKGLGGRKFDDDEEVKTAVISQRSVFLLRSGSHMFRLNYRAISSRTQKLQGSSDKYQCTGHTCTCCCNSFLCN